MEVFSPYLAISLRFFWHLLQPNWSIIWGKMSLWSMFKKRQSAVFEGKCRQFRNSSECLKTHCAANNWPIWNLDPKGAKRSVKIWVTNFYESFCKYTVSNKNTHLANFETCVFRGYLRNHLSYKKSFWHLFESLSEELSDEKRIFQIRSQNQLILAKTLFCQKKVS